MKRSHPLAVTMPTAGILFAESVHAGDFHMARRTDLFHKLLYVLHGHVSYAEKGRNPEILSAGMLVVIPSGMEHEIRDQLPSTLLLLCLSPSFLRGDAELTAIWDELAGRDARRIALSRPSRHQAESAWRQAMLERIRPRTGSSTTIKALAAQLLVTLVRLPALKTSIDSYARVAAVAREMENSFYDEWNLDRAAVRAGISRRHFSGLFSKLQGRTFWEHLTELRLNHAIELLRKGDHSVTGVVFACGFGDVSQFYRLFRKRFNQPPKQWASSAVNAP